MPARRVTSLLPILALAAVAAAACGREAPAPAARPAAVTIGPESVYTVAREDIASGPLVSGSLHPDLEATMRAEVAGAVLELPVEEGQSVARGAVLARIDATALRDAVLSARSGLRSAKQQLELARRNEERTARLESAGAMSRRELETAQSGVTGAEAAVADAAARVALAEEQLAKTVVRAPFAGIVSKKSANPGDTISPGSELVTIVDPATMVLEAGLPAARLAEVRIGMPVRFTVTGYPGQTFEGTIDRISPVADPATRQVQIHVHIPNVEGRLVGGLYAEGRVDTAHRDGITVPATAVDETSGAPSVLRLADGKAAKVPVALGIRDEKNEKVEITSGLAAGDRVLVGAARTIAPGTAVQIAAEGAAPAAEAPAAAAANPIGG